MAFGRTTNIFYLILTYLLAVTQAGTVIHWVWWCFGGLWKAAWVSASVMLLFGLRNLCVWNTHTHTRLTALFPRLPRWAGTRKVKLIWILLKQETEWQWHQPGRMQVCTWIQTDNHTSTPPLCFLQAGCPSCSPTNSVKALKACEKKLEISLTTLF